MEAYHFLLPLACKLLTGQLKHFALLWKQKGDYMQLQDFQEHRSKNAFHWKWAAVCIWWGDTFNSEWDSLHNSTKYSGEIRAHVPRLISLISLIFPLKPLRPWRHSWRNWAEWEGNRQFSKRSSQRLTPSWFLLGGKWSPSSLRWAHSDWMGINDEVDKHIF